MVIDSYCKRQESTRVCDSSQPLLSGVVYDPLFNSRHNSKDRTEKVGDGINWGSLGVTMFPQCYRQQNHSIECIRLIQLYQRLCICLVPFSSYCKLFIESGRF